MNLALQSTTQWQRYSELNINFFTQLSIRTSDYDIYLSEHKCRLFREFIKPSQLEHSFFSFFFIFLFFVICFICFTFLIIYLCSLIQLTHISQDPTPIFTQIESRTIIMYFHPDLLILAINILHSLCLTLTYNKQSTFLLYIYFETTFPTMWPKNHLSSQTRTGKIYLSVNYFSLEPDKRTSVNVEHWYQTSLTIWSLKK